MAIQGYKNAPTPSDPAIPATTTNGAINAAVTSITFVSVANLPAAGQFTILLENEIILVTSLAGLVGTVTRGQEGTTAATHVTATEVFCILSAAALLRLPRAMTTSGDTEYLNSSGAPTRLAAPSNGAYNVTWTSAVPSWTAATAGTVTSVALTVPSILSVAGSPITGAGTLAVSLATQAANLIFAGPATGAAATPTFRALVAADITGLAVPGGAASSVQYNNAGAFGGSSDLTLVAAGLTNLRHTALGNVAALDVYHGYPTTTGSIPLVIDEVVTTPLTALDTMTGLYVGLLLQPTANATALIYGTDTDIWTAASAFTYAPIQLNFLHFTHQGSGVVQSVYGQAVVIEHSGAGSIDYVNLFDGQLYPEGRPVGNVVGVYLYFDPSGTYTTARGLHLNDQAGLTVSGVNRAIDYANKFIVDADGKVTVPAAGLTIGANLVTLAGALTTSGAFGLTLTQTALTNVTLPTTGTLATLAGSEAFTNKIGAISQWTNDAGYLTSVTAHNVLSATHGDTLAASVVRGHLIVGNATPNWAALAIGTVGKILQSDGTDVSWAAPTGTGVPVLATSPSLTTPILGVASATSLSIGVVGSGATLRVKGAGATSATKSLVIEDSAAVDILAISDDGRLGLGKPYSMTANAIYSPLILGADFTGQLVITNTFNGISAAVSAFFADIRFAGTQEYTRASGMEFIARSTNTHTANVLTGIVGTATIGSASGRATTLLGGSFTAKTEDATGGTVVTLAGLKTTTAVNHASVTATTAYGVYVSDITNSGTITTTYGLYVGDVTSGTQTNQAYSLYLSDTAARNYLGGLTGIGVTAPTAALHLIAGTATASTAPLKFTSGTNLTTAEAGAMEYNGTNLFFTRAGTVRENVLVAVDNAAAPSASVGIGIVNFYGASATNFLGDPNRWLSVNVLGVVYKVPLYT